MTEEELKARETPELGAGAWVATRHAAQAPPDFAQDGSPWRTWVFLGGRGAGKTRAGAEWVWDEALRLGQLTGGYGRIALVGATMHDVRSVMVEGPSGLMRLAHREGARLETSLRRIRFPGGCVAEMYSAEEPDRLRGPQFHAAWGDELCAWRQAEETLAMLRLGLRLKSGGRGCGGPRLMLIEQQGPGCEVKRVVARWGKVVRAEPVAALYEQGRVGHAPGLGALEEELMGMGFDAGGASPDRADALVWAMTELMIQPGAAVPRVRSWRDGG